MLGSILLIVLLILGNFYFAVLIKDGYNEIYEENLNKFKKSLLLIPPVGIFIGLCFLIYFIIIILADKIKNYFN
jgi:hypothetical protein